MRLQLERAKLEHVKNICELVNLAYRGDSGWTKETDLVGGTRSTVSEIEKYVVDLNTTLLVAIAHNEVVSCICIEMKRNTAYMGLFAVHPQLQGQGVGADILSQAEQYAAATLRAEKYAMIVVSQRVELISYYERRGYFRKGHIENYPTHMNVGIPLNESLTIERLEKNASKNIKQELTNS